MYEHNFSDRKTMIRILRIFVFYGKSVRIRVVKATNGQKNFFFFRSFIKIRERHQSATSKDIAIILLLLSTLAEGKTGIDPRIIFMNGSLNVVTGFSLGIIYEYDDPDFIRLAYFVQEFFKNMAFIYVGKVATEITPMFILEQPWYRKLRRLIRKDFGEDRFRIYCIPYTCMTN